MVGARAKQYFGEFSRASAAWFGGPIAFSIALATVLLWGAVGPFFHFSDEWSLFINTSTTIVTFLMVFLIQNTQNRDMVALHLKLDELIIAVQGARNEVVAAEKLSDDEILKMKPALDNRDYKDGG